MSERFSATNSPAILLALYNATRALSLYPAENEAVRRTIAEVESSAGRVFEKEGGISIWMAGKYLFLNDLQVKLDLSDYAVLSALRESLRSHGIGRIDVQPSISSEEWVAFLSALSADPVAGQPPLEAFRLKLEQAGVRRLQIGPPSPLFEGHESAEAVEARGPAGRGPGAAGSGVDARYVDAARL
jgi:hypothetical protein